MDISHLVLELKLNNQLKKMDIFSRESNPGIWDVNGHIVLLVFKALIVHGDAH
jgi:hypothetical protein